jgi:hypothetical protein
MAVYPWRRNVQLRALSLLPCLRRDRALHARAGADLDCHSRWAFADPAFPAPTVSVYESRMHGWVVPPPDAEHFP